MDDKIARRVDENRKLCAQAVADYRLKKSRRMGRRVPSVNTSENEVPHPSYPILYPKRGRLDE